MEMVSFLVEHQASVNQADSEGWTPLHVAASCGYPDIAECVEYCPVGSGSRLKCGWSCVAHETFELLIFAAVV